MIEGREESETEEQDQGLGDRAIGGSTAARSGGEFTAPQKPAKCHRERIS